MVPKVKESDKEEDKEVEDLVLGVPTNGEATKYKLEVA